MTLPSYMRTFNPLRAISVVLGRRIASWRARHILRRGEPALRCADLPLVGVGDMRKQILSHGGHAEQIISSADRVVRGEYAIFSKLVREPRIVPDWKRDYCFGQEWLASTKYQPGPTDIKCIWEMNRLQFLPVVGLAFLLTEDQRYLDFVQSTLLSWNASNPVFSSPNWNSPMEVALRSISIVLTLSFIRDAIREGSEFFAIITKSLFEHGVFVECNLEIGFYGTRGNHFLSDILGLLVLGLAFRGTRRGRKWMRYSRGQLEFCIKRQVDDDGTYFEHSTSYHRLVLEIFTYGYLIGNQNGVSFSARYAAKLERMFECASCYIRPDGLTVQAGDADDGRVLILTDYFSWDRRDHRYLLDFGAALFDRVELVPSGPGPCVELLLFAGSERIAKLRTERPHDRHDTDMK